MKILLIGKVGQLGHDIISKANDFHFEIEAVDLPEFDITDSTCVENAVSNNNIQLVINASAYTAVDKAETEPEIAYAVNSEGPEILAKSCQKNGKPLIHISTDYVFDGKQEAPYSEDDPVSPIGIYGKSKQAGEVNVRSNLAEHIIIRTAWLYGINGNNFVKTMLRLGKEQKELRVVSDQYGCPTWSMDLALAILTMAQEIRDGNDIKWGTYHFCGKGVPSWHEFAEEIFKIARLQSKLKVNKVVPLKTEEYPTPAKRPENSSLDCSLITKNFGIEPCPWQESLNGMIKDFLMMS